MTLRRMRMLRKIPIEKILGVFVVLSIVSGCVMPAKQTELWRAGNTGISGSSPTPEEGSLAGFLRPIRKVGDPILTPTPNPPQILPTLRNQTDTVVLQPGDTLGTIAKEYGVTVGELVSVNQISNPDLVEVGQVIVIPAPSPQPSGPSFKIIPDSELVYGPASVNFDIFAFVREKNGYLASYRETLDEQIYTGAEVIQRVAREQSVNPRLLLAVLEYQSGWVTEANPLHTPLEAPMGNSDSWRTGLYLQLAWAGNELNRGFNQFKNGWIGSWLLVDGSVVPVDATINPGTAGIQQLMARLHNRSGWEKAVGTQGVYDVYYRLFGYPFDYSLDPLVPPGLTQPEMQLPFEEYTVWSFTGGPHGGWGDGAPWAGLDFAPPGSGFGCILSYDWVTAAARGLVVRSELGVVVVDLDGDGFEQTGWSVLYLHIATDDRVKIGTYVEAGDHIGHPSCEGGVSSGTHVHIARRYNGEWIAADGDVPFVLDGWTAESSGVAYNGILKREGQVVEAWDRVVEENQISR